MEKYTARQAKYAPDKNNLKWLLSCQKLCFFIYVIQKHLFLMLWTAFYMHSTVFLEGVLRISGGQHQLLYPEDKRVPKLFPHVEILNRLRFFPPIKLLPHFVPAALSKSVKTAKIYARARVKMCTECK